MVTTTSPMVILGITQMNGKIYGLPLQWKQNNGILIAGLSGSGKSQTAAWLLTQYAEQGVKLIVCDYDAPIGDEESEALSDRIAHLSKAFLLPPVRKVEDIKRYLALLDAEYQQRLNDHTRRFPIMFVIDEVSALLSTLKDEDDNGIQKFATKMLQMRKVNMRNMIIGQEWSSGFSTQLMRPIRSAFRVKIIHTLDSANAKLVLDMPTSDDMRKIAKLDTGQIYYDGNTYKVPLLSDKYATKVEIALEEYEPENISAAVNTPVTYNWTKEEEEIYMAALFRLGPKINKSALDTREDLIRHIIVLGQNNEYIKQHVKGSPNDNIAIANTIRQTLKYE